MDWNDLSMAEKADVMKIAVDGGVYDLDAIRNGYNEYAKGGKIHIKPSKRGTFTAAASKHGKSVQTFASQVLAHPENYSPAMRRKANFARNASHWKHGLGGNLFAPGGDTKASDYRYVLDNDGEWNRVANDEIGRVFQGLTITPKKVKESFVPTRYDNSLEAAEARDKFFQYRDKNGNIKGEPGLEIVSPEFDLLSLGPIWKSAGSATVQQVKSAISAPKMLESDLVKDAIKAAKITKGTIKLRPLSKDKVNEGYQRMIDFISSPEYNARLKNAGLEGYQDYMINLVNKRMGKNLKVNTAELIENNPKYRGLSEMFPLADDYGITIREDLVGNDFLNTFDHELAHWTTKNTEPGLADLRRVVTDWKIPSFKLNKIMRYNDKIPVKPGNALSGQERRARAYAMYQEAERRGITTDELVDKYTIEDEIIGNAPLQLQKLGESYTTDNLKKYLKSFLSGAAPITLGIEASK